MVRTIRGNERAISWIFCGASDFQTCSIGSRLVTNTIMKATSLSLVRDHRFFSGLVGMGCRCLSFFPVRSEFARKLCLAPTNFMRTLEIHTNSGRASPSLAVRCQFGSGIWEGTGVFRRLGEAGDDACAPSCTSTGQIDLMASGLTFAELSDIMQL